MNGYFIDTIRLKLRRSIKGYPKNWNSAIYLLDTEYGKIRIWDTSGNQKEGFGIDFKINREDFGLTWNAALETGGVMVSTDVRIISNIQLIKKA